MFCHLSTRQPYLYLPLLLITSPSREYLFFASFRSHFLSSRSSFALAVNSIEGVNWRRVQCILGASSERFVANSPNRRQIARRFEFVPHLRDFAVTNRAKITLKSARVYTREIERDDLVDISC